ncbi:MAG: SDR family oxidoreductase [Bacillota bacterium]
MKVLFIGGTGIISEACTWKAAETGFEVYLFNRGETKVPLPEGVRILRGDIRDREGARKVLDGRRFDAVVNWIAYVPEHIETDLSLFRGRTGQYVFISSASVYQKPLSHFMITESTPLANPFWEYSRNKIACELRLMQAYREENFPVTIVRPSYTYSYRLVPCAVGSGPVVLDRIKKGLEVIVHGDGKSLWVMTHHRDFAEGFTGLLGNIQALGESFHITSDEVLTWDQIYNAIGLAAGKEPRIVHLPSELIQAYNPHMGAGLLGDKAYSAVFDNSKIKRIVPGFQARVPFVRGVKEAVAWVGKNAAPGDREREESRWMDRVIASYREAFSG